MRVIHKEGPYNLGIYEPKGEQVRNYVVFDERKNQTTTDKNGKARVKRFYAYHTKMHQALADLSRRRGDEVSDDLSKWMEELGGAVRALKTLCQGM